MVRSVTFNGITKFKPGGITKINAEALNQVTSGENSIVALIGEADGGVPSDTGGVTTVFNPAKASELFRSGPLVDAVRLAFQSSNDPDVPGGASRVLVYKTNSSTQASTTFSSDRLYKIVDSSATGGSSTTLIDTAVDPSGSRAYPDDYFNNMWLVVKPLTANQEVRQISDFDGSTDTFTVSSSFGVTPTGGDAYEVYKGEAVDVADVSSIAPSTPSITLTGTSYSTDEHAGRWVVFHVTDGGGGELTYTRRIASNTGTVLTLEGTLPTSLGSSDPGWVEILPIATTVKSEDYGLHTNGISVDLDKESDSGDRSARTFSTTVKFEGDENGSSSLGGEVMLVLYNNGSINTADTAASGSTATSINLTTGGLSAGAHVGAQVKINDEYTSISANATGSITVAPPLSEAPSSGDPVEILDTNVRTHAIVSGSDGVASSFDVNVYDASSNELAGESTSISITSSTTLQDLKNELEATGSFTVSITQGISPNGFLAKNLDYGQQTESIAIVSPDLVRNDYASTFVTDNPVTGLTAHAHLLSEYYDVNSDLVNASRATDTGDGAGSLLMTSDFVALSGGQRGSSTNTDFQSGFDALLKVRANSVVPLIDQDLTNEGNGSTATVASVAAQLGDHVAVSRGASQGMAGERGGFLGFRGTKSEIISQANSLNDMDVQLVAQHPTAINASGSLEEFGPRMFAVMASSMRAGVVEVAEPLTHKYIRVSGLTQDSSWDPADLTDANEFIENGILFAETIDGKGTRWVRDLTTHVQDDNLAYMEGSVRDAVRYVAYNLREFLVDRFTGKKSSPATIGSIRDAAATFLETARSDSIIVDSTDPATGETIRAYHNLKVTASGDIVNINVGLFPVPGINFQLSELFLQLPTQSA